MKIFYNFYKKVPLLFSSLNKSDVFILDDNEKIYQWNPPGN